MDDHAKTIENLTRISEIHAEGMKHMTNALIAMDQRIKELEKAERRRGKHAPRLVVPVHVGGIA